MVIIPNSKTTDETNWTLPANPQQSYSNHQLPTAAGKTTRTNANVLMTSSCYRSSSTPQEIFKNFIDWASAINGY